MTFMKLHSSYCEGVLTFISNYQLSLESSGMDSSLVCGSEEGNDAVLHPDIKGCNTHVMKFSAPKQVQSGLRKQGEETGLPCI